MIDFLVWNARGEANRPTVAHLKLLVHSYKLLFLVILEPVIDLSEATKIEKNIGLPTVYSNEYEEGKVWLLTKESWRISIVHMDNQSISFTGNWKDKSCLFSIIYAK